MLSPVKTDATMLTNNSQHCWMLHVASVCTPCCMLLGVFAQSLKPLKLFNQRLPTSLLLRDRWRVALQCWIRLHSSLQHCWAHASALHTVYKVLRVASFPRFTADLNIIGSCCVHLHTTANTDATTSNIVGPTMLGAGSCCVRLHVAFSYRTANIGQIVPALPDILSLKVGTH